MHSPCYIVTMVPLSVGHPSSVVSEPSPTTRVCLWVEHRRNQPRGPSAEPPPQSEVKRPLLRIALVLRTARHLQQRNSLSLEKIKKVKEQVHPLRDSKSDGYLRPNDALFWFMRHSPYGTIGMCLVIQGKVVDIEQENQTGTGVAAGQEARRNAFRKLLNVATAHVGPSYPRGRRPRHGSGLCSSTRCHASREEANVWEPRWAFL